MKNGVKDLNTLKKTVRENVEKQGMVSLALIENMLFNRLRIKDTDIERYYFPALNSGCLTAKNVLDIMLLKCPYKLRNLLLKEQKIITEEDIRTLYIEYLEESYYSLSEEEIRLLLTREIYSDYEFGQMSELINIGMFDVYAGSVCRELFTKSDIDNPQRYVAVGVDGASPKLLTFLEFRRVEELERAIRVLLLMKEGVEFTAKTPVYKTDYVYAIRPPVDEWGIAIRKGDSKKWAKKYAFTVS